MTNESVNEIPVEQWTVLLSGTLYLLSLITPVVGAYPGFVAFIVKMGSVIWLANPLYVIAVCFLWELPLLSFGLGMAACLLSLLPAVVGMPDDGLRIGYFLWCGSFVVFINGAGIRLWLSGSPIRRRRSTDFSDDADILIVRNALPLWHYASVKSLQSVDRSPRKRLKGSGYLLKK